MKVIEELTAEHDLIERVAGALRTYVRRRLEGTADAADAARFLRFFRGFVGGWHHEREEQGLFVALTEGLGLLAEQAPVGALTGQHHDLAASLEALEPLLASPALDPARQGQLDEVARRYVYGLWHHIDAENSVLFPEADARLSRGGVPDVPWREPTAEEVLVRADGERLVGEHPPVHDPVVMRGDGCVFCPSYGTTCRGIELTWWGESEWDSFGDSMG